MNLAPPGALEEARRALAGSRALWREGLVPEGAAYAARALHAMLQAWMPASTALETDSPRHEVLALAALDEAGYRHLGGLREALTATTDVAALTRAAAAPASPTIARRDLERIWAEVERLSAFTRRRLVSPRRRKQVRRRMLVVLGAVVIVAALFSVQLWGRPRVSASAIFAPDYSTVFAVDGLDASEWLLPDATPGWLEIAFPSPRRVRGVRLVNAHNRYYVDRASERVRVTAFSADGPVASAEGRFAALSPERSLLDLVVDAQRVTHLRVEVLSYYGKGGGLAEVEVR